MRRHVQLGLLGLAIVGCAAQYRQPSIQEPHANVEIRAIDHAGEGQIVAQNVSVDGQEVSLTEAGNGVQATTLRVRPDATSYDFHTELFHDDVRWETETYNHPETVLCGSTQFGPQYCNYDFARTRTVPVRVRVRDGACDTHFNQRPVPGATYVLQYEIVADDICRVTCQRLSEDADGTQRAVPCD